MAKATNWRADLRRGRVRLCSRDVRYAADVADISASPIAPHGASKRLGMSATARTAISVIGTAKPSPDHQSTRPSERLSLRE
jgi:hypothetical protein